MNHYVLTVFDRKGKKLVDEQFTAENDEKAKTLSMERLQEEQLSDYPYRCASSDARLLLFNN